MGIEWANNREVREQLTDQQTVDPVETTKSTVDFQSAKFSVYRAAWMFDNGQDTRPWSSMAKSKSTETLQQVLDG
jgi:alkylation response protein AidB-like acyl-CoA dehydrogenase